MKALGLLNELVEEGKGVGEIRIPVDVVGDAVIDELLEEVFLLAWVIDHAVKEPGEERRSGREAGAGDDHHVADEQIFGHLFSLFVSRPEDVVENALRSDGSIVHGHVELFAVGKMKLLAVVNGVLDNTIHLLLDLLQLLSISPRQPAVPLATCGDTLVEMEVVGYGGDDRVERGFRRLELAEIQIQREFANGLRSQLQHIVVRIPCLATLIELIKHLEGTTSSHLHKGSVVTDSLGAHGWREELVR